MTATRSARTSTPTTLKPRSANRAATGNPTMPRPTTPIRAVRFSTFSCSAAIDIDITLASPPSLLDLGLGKPPLRPAQSIGEDDLRRPAEDAPDPVDADGPARDGVDVALLDIGRLAVRLPVQRQHQARQRVDVGLDAGADVEDLAHRGGRYGRCQCRVDGVVDVGEIAGLPAVT